jgi:hypothetical protein
MARSALPTSGCLLAAHCLFSPGVVHAYRPFDGTDADVAAPGEFELELGPVEYVRDGSDNYLLVPATVLNLGIFPRTEFIVDFVGTIPLQHEAGQAGYRRDSAVFLKFLLRKGVLQNEDGPSIALEAGPLLPQLNGDQSFGAAADLIFSEKVGWFFAYLNNELELSRENQEFAWSNNLIAEFRVNETIWPVTELTWQREIKSGESTYSALVGSIWSVTEGFDFDAAGVVASVEGELALEARLGLTWVFNVWKSGSTK